MGIERPLRRVLLTALALGAVVCAPCVATAQLSCLQQSKGALLAQFSDNAPPNTIAPVNIRNIICSVVLGQGQGQSVVPLIPATSPFVYTATSVGTLVVNSGLVSISRDAGVTFYQAGAMGGSFPLLANDQVRIVWYEPGPFGIPTATFFPSSSP